MKTDQKDSTIAEKDKPNTFWYRVYGAVIVTTVLVIAGLWLFSLYFSR